jgi:hypothetical protein
MLLLSPALIRFSSFAWSDAVALAVDRLPKRIIEDHSDRGPFAAFADVPEQSIHITLKRRITGDDADDPPLGASGDLVVHSGPPANALARTRITIPCTLVSIRSELPVGKPATRTLTFIATSPDGTDPVTIEPAP